MICYTPYNNRTDHSLVAPRKLTRENAFLEVPLCTQADVSKSPGLNPVVSRQTTVFERASTWIPRLTRSGRAYSGGVEKRNNMPNDEHPDVDEDGSLPQTSEALPIRRVRDKSKLVGSA